MFISIALSVPPERRKRGRSRRGCRDEVLDAMKARMQEENLCLDTIQWKLGKEISASNSPGMLANHKKMNFFFLH